MIVGGVEAESPAERAGIVPGDILFALDGHAITGADELIRTLTADKIGKTVEINILREGARRRVALTAEERPRRG